MSFELIFFVLWIIFILFAGNKNGRKVTKALSEVIKETQRNQRTQKPFKRDKRTRHNPFTEEEPPQPYQQQTYQPEPIPAPPISDVQTERMLDALSEHVNEKSRRKTPSQLKPKKPLQPLSIEESADHQANINHGVDDMVNARRAKKAQAQRGALLKGSVRNAFIFKELLDKPVSMRD